MSLQLAANHLSAQGRGPDSTLVHMSPGEVNSLQGLAMAHGGSLTINPETGLPEAGFLSSILPMVAGAALMATGVGAPMAAMMVGGGMTVATGSLQKGIVAGLGAYGGAGLAGGLMGAGAGAAASATAPGAEVLDAALAGSGGAGGAGIAGVAGSAPLPVTELSPKVLDAAMANTANQVTAATAPVTPGFSASLPASDVLGAPMTSAQPYVPGIGEAPPALAQAPSTPTIPTTTPLPSPEAPSFGDRLSQMGKGIESLGTEQGRGAFMKSVDGGKGLLKYGAAAGLPLLVSQPKPLNVPTGGPNPYNFAFDPGREEDPEAEYTGAPTGERRYFKPKYRRLAGGGPVEEMSLSNVYDMQNARGGVSDMGIDNSTGMQRMARGGISHLGDYSDGGRLLRGPGDGVSDSIPAMIGNKQPARLADGEFVVPARIVSELGNGSTEAGARKLYAMMDRIQSARGKTTGKNRVAANTRSDKYLPA
jgi:hypothetical protein